MYSHTRQIKPGKSASKQDGTGLGKIITAAKSIDTGTKGMDEKNGKDTCNLHQREKRNAET